MCRKRSRGSAARALLHRRRTQPARPRRASISFATATDVPCRTGRTGFADLLRQSAWSTIPARRALPAASSRGGNVFGAEGLEAGTRNLRFTTGAELRLFVPVFGLPLRFIYANNLTPLPGDRFESFQFDVGTSF